MFIPAIAMTLAALAPAAPPQAAAQQPAILTTQQICPVTGKPVPEGLGVRASVRGRDYTTFDGQAALELKANPDKYLLADGTPRNLPKKE